MFGNWIHRSEKRRINKKIETSKHIKHTNIQLTTNTLKIVLHYIGEILFSYTINMNFYLIL